MFFAMINATQQEVVTLLGRSRSPELVEYISNAETRPRNNNNSILTEEEIIKLQVRKVRTGVIFTN